MATPNPGGKESLPDAEVEHELCARVQESRLGEKVPVAAAQSAAAWSMEAAADSDESKAVREWRVEQSDGNLVVEGHEGASRQALDHRIEGPASVGDLVEGSAEAHVARLHAELDDLVRNGRGNGNGNDAAGNRARPG